jgi:chloride channel protein, CIC family
MLLPLLAASVIAHAFTVLFLKRSILTEKVARRGYHLSREYAVDPLEILFVRDAMRTNLVAFQSGSTLADVKTALHSHHGPRGQFLYPVVDADNRLHGVITRRRIQKHLDDPAGRTLAELASDPVVAYPDEPLRVVVYRMAELGLTRFPVVERGDHRRLLGIIGLRDLLTARTRNLEEERTRERVLRIRMPMSGRDRRTA